MKIEQLPASIRVVVLGVITPRSRASQQVRVFYFGRDEDAPLDLWQRVALEDVIY